MLGSNILEQKVFTFQVLREAILSQFKESGEILVDLVRLIGFDAIVGNQDRHLFNWGVIVPTHTGRPSRFAPVYDTARGLFWNTAEGALAKFNSDYALEKYAAGARSLIGWDGEEDPNHFRLAVLVAAALPTFHQVLRKLDPH